MNSTPNEALSAVRRLKQQVYVDIPPSPLHRTPVAASGSGQLKENTPWTLSHANTIQSQGSSAFHKRKLFERDAPGEAMSGAKKPKLDVTTSMSSAMPTTDNACPEFPNGFIHCHQCRKKYDPIDSVHCTYVGDSGRRQRRCTSKFCRPCLKNRYGEDIDEIKSQCNKKKEKGHIDGTSYTFECPKCRHICSCWKCRKLRGLEPIGNIGNVRKAETGSAAKVLARNPSAVKSVQVEKKSKSKAVLTETTTNITAPKATASSVTKSKPKPKPPPIVKWTKLHVHLDLGEAEARFQIREFVLRFAPIMEPTIAKAYLEELEDICGRSKGRDDSEEMTGWVSEACARSILLGLLGLLADQDQDTEKSIKAAMRDIRSSGINLTKIWAILVTLREPSGSILWFPDPLPPPTATTIHNTRTTRSARESSSSKPTVQIVYSAQMVPVYEALVEAALETEAIHMALELGVSEGKDMVREAREGCRRENERWENVRKEMEATLKDKEQAKAHWGETKAKRESHKRQLQNIDNALKIVLPAFTPRFAPLGTDHEGRIFWALSPGITERDAALGFISSMTSEAEGQLKKGKKRGQSWGEEERSAMIEWSWFVGVWGKRPPVGKTSKVNKLTTQHKADGDDEESDDEDAEKWWGFWEPKEIRTVADWIAVKSGLNLDDDEGVGNSPVASLVKGLKEYAGLLEWRVRENKYELEATGDTNDSESTASTKRNK